MTGGGCWCPGTLWKPHHNPTWQLNVYTHRITLALAQRVEWNGKLSETFLISVVFSVITGNCLNEDNVWTFPLQLHDIFFISAILRQIIFLFICSVLYYTFIKKATLFFNPFFFSLALFRCSRGADTQGGVKESSEAEPTESKEKRRNGRGRWEGWEHQGLWLSATGEGSLGRSEGSGEKKERAKEWGKMRGEVSTEVKKWEEILFWCEGWRERCSQSGQRTRGGGERKRWRGRVDSRQ